MSLITIHRRKTFAAAAGLALAVAGVAGYAVADAGTDANRAETFYAQVAVDSEANGTIVRQHNVDSVEKVGTGQYCVKVANDNNVDVEVGKTIPFVNRYWGRGWARVDPRPNAICNNAADTYYVAVYDGSWAAQDGRFRLMVP